MDNPNDTAGALRVRLLDLPAKYATTTAPVWLELRFNTLPHTANPRNFILARSATVNRTTTTSEKSPRYIFNQNMRFVLNDVDLQSVRFYLMTDKTHQKTTATHDKNINNSNSARSCSSSSPSPLRSRHFIEVGASPAERLELHQLPMGQWIECSVPFFFFDDDATSPSSNNQSTSVLRRESSLRVLLLAEDFGQQSNSKNLSDDPNSSPSWSRLTRSWVVTEALCGQYLRDKTPERLVNLLEAVTLYIRASSPHSYFLNENEFRCSIPTQICIDFLQDFLEHIVVTRGLQLDMNFCLTMIRDVVEMLYDDRVGAIMEKSANPRDSFLERIIKSSGGNKKNNNNSKATTAASSSSSLEQSVSSFIKDFTTVSDIEEISRVMSEIQTEHGLPAVESMHLSDIQTLQWRNKLCKMARDKVQEFIVVVDGIIIAASAEKKKKEKSSSSSDGAAVGLTGRPYNAQLLGDLNNWVTKARKYSLF